MHDDFHPYCVSYGDDVNITTDYSQDAEIWMKPSKQGLKSSVVEIPGNAFFLSPTFFTLRSVFNLERFFPELLVEELMGVPRD